MAIDASAAWQRSGNNANSHGSFAAAAACDDLVETVSATMGELLGAEPDSMVFGPSTTANMMALTRAIGRGLGPGDEIVCTTLDHDSNVAPWLLLARDTGATVRMAELDPGTGRLAAESVIDLIGPATRWVAVTGSSNAVGAIPDVAAVTAAAHRAGAKVVVDGVHLTPHRCVNVGALGCDVFTTSSYKWYGPHAGIMCVEPGLLEELDAYKVRPAPESGPGRLQYGTPSWEALAGVDAAARFLLETGMDVIAAHEAIRFARLLDGLHGIETVRVVGPADTADRAPTLMFEVEGLAPLTVAERLAAAGVAVWDGHNYAVEAMAPLDLDSEAGAVRAGVSLYTTDDEVDHLLDAGGHIAGSG
ncbi:MAG: aminotransferase class V-fold PLP-dependent enzyme [Actinobacteria bacterium]|nr:aminotransferase class V-fold PLP-dependent enzyme [Actinomycetota bacterium]